jgi:hypothetical protein
MPSHGAYVYLIREGSRIKVGRTKSVVSRLRLFQTGNAEECHVVAAIWLLNAEDIEKQLKDDLAEFRHRGEWFTVSTRKALEALTTLRKAFLYDEPRQFDLPTPQNPRESECRSRFLEWIKKTYPNAQLKDYPERELWPMLKDEFLTSHRECDGIERKENWRYDLNGSNRGNTD